MLMEIQFTAFRCFNSLWPLTCGCVGIFDGQLFGRQARLSDGGAGSEAAGVETAQKQGETQDHHLEIYRGREGGNGEVQKCINHEEVEEA